MNALRPLMKQASDAGPPFASALDVALGFAHLDFGRPMNFTALIVSGALPAIVSA